MKNKNSNLFLIGVIILLAMIILAIYLSQPKPIDQATVKCIAQNSHLYISKTCGHCAQQKQILGEHLSSFNTTECLDNVQICMDKGIKYVPAWEINGQIHNGVLEMEELKNLAGC